MMAIQEDNKAVKDKALQERNKQADIYASQPELFSILSLEIMMRSHEGDAYFITYDEGWRCTCGFYRERGACSHVMAVGKLLKNFSFLRPGST